jgi:hypothetical protein
MRPFVIVASILLLPSLARAQEIRIEAADLATPGQRAGEPTPGKWWLQDGVLASGKVADKKPKDGEWQVLPVERFIPKEVPTLVIDPKVKGWHRIYVGLVHDPVEPNGKLFARLTREPYPEYLMAPERTKTRTAEVYWKAADLTDQKIHLNVPPAPMQHPGRFCWAGITHVYLVPMALKGEFPARKEVELPPKNQRLFGMLDYTDEVFWWGTVEKEDDIRAIVYRHRESGFGRIYWRAYGSCSDHTLDVPEAAPRWTDKDEARWCKTQRCEVGWMPYNQLPKKFDPLKVAVEYGAKNDIEVHGWVRFTNHNREPYSNFWWDNRDKVAQLVVTRKDEKTGKVEPVVPYKYTPYSRVLSLAYPEVRAYYVKFFKAMADTGTKGILIDLLRHPPIAGFEPIVSDAFKKKYGKDMHSLNLYRDPLVQEHLSSYFRLFLVDLRKAVGKDLEISVRSSGPDQFALRGKEWIEEGLINSIIDGNWYSGNGPRPTIDATVAAVGKKGRAYAIIETGDVDPLKNWAKRPGTLSVEAIEAFTNVYRGKKLAGFGLYESTVFTYAPELRRAVRAAGWRFTTE